MQKEDGALPRGRSIRNTLSVLGRPRSILPWILGTFGALWKLAEITHTTEFLVKVLYLPFGPLWLMLASIVWFALIVLWAARRPDGRQRAQELEALKLRIIHAVNALEELARAYESGLTMIAEPAVLSRREEFMKGLTWLTVYAVRAAAPEARQEYVELLKEAAVDRLLFHAAATKSVYASKSDPIAAILEAAEILEKDKPAARVRLWSRMFDR